MLLWKLDDGRSLLGHPALASHFVQIPIRLAAAMDSRRSAGMLAALGFATVVMVSTPFLINAISAEYDVGLTVAAQVGVLQLAGFAVASWGSGNWLRPTRSVLVGALFLAVAANAGSAWLPPLPLLLSLRFISGLSLGTITWFAWANAFGVQQKMSQVAVVGPVIGVLSTPLVALVIERWGMRELFVMLAVLPILPLSLSSTVPDGERRDRGERHRAATTARVVLLALTAFSLGGSAVYQLGVTIGARELGLSSSTVALAYTANSLISIPAAGWRGRRGIPGPWMALTGASAFFVATAFTSTLFVAALVCWGFFYWMAIPGVYSVLAGASTYPAERAGDAQAMMAAGRVAGPFLGGVLIDGPGVIGLGMVAAGLMVGAAAAVFAVRETTATGGTTL